MDEETIKNISEAYEYQVNLLKRKEDVIRLIDEKGLMTDELRDKIMKAEKLVDVEDLYRPYKEKKKTKATDAINNGFEYRLFVRFVDVVLRYGSIVCCNGYSVAYGKERLGSEYLSEGVLELVVDEFYLVPYTVCILLHELICQGCCGIKCRFI